MVTTRSDDTTLQVENESKHMRETGSPKHLMRSIDQQFDEKERMYQEVYSKIRNEALNEKRIIASAGTVTRKAIPQARSTGLPPTVQVERSASLTRSKASRQLNNRTSIKDGEGEEIDDIYQLL